MKKIPRRLILSVAERLIDEMGVVSQQQIFRELSKHKALRRELRREDKIRITKILTSEFYVVERRREGHEGRRFIYLTRY